MRSGLQGEDENENENDRFKPVGLGRGFGRVAYQREAPAPRSTFK